MISLEEARRQILARVVPIGNETVTLVACHGRTLGEDVHSRDDIPPFDNTAMDGFAVRVADTRDATAENTVRLEVIGVIEAGSPAERSLAPGQAYRIFTGAPMPPGADGIVPFEDAVEYGADFLLVGQPSRPGAFIRPRGDDIKSGSQILSRGALLTPAAVGLLATVGRAQVTVARRPRVAIHSSGNELIPIDAELTPGMIRNSNLYSLAARVSEIGAEPLLRPVLADDPEAVRRGLRQTLTLRPDAIVTTGGISAGDLDCIREVARELGDDVSVRKVEMKPGKPLVDGLIGGVPYFGLPGNPAACLVSFEMFVRPALAAMENRPHLPQQRRARVTETRQVGSGARRQFLRGRVEYDAASQEYVLLPTGKQGSHVMTSFADANCLVELAAGTTTVEEHQLVDVWML